MTASASKPKNLQKEFVCDAACCVPNKAYRWKVGKTFATSLTGFVAGVIVATIILYPWLNYLGDYCPTGR